MKTDKNDDLLMKCPERIFVDYISVFEMHFETNEKKLSCIDSYFERC